MSMFRSKIIEPRCTQGDLSPASTVPVTSYKEFAD